jgi:hypothetical protein
VSQGLWSRKGSDAERRGRSANDQELSHIHSFLIRVSACRLFRGEAMGKV